MDFDDSSNPAEGLLQRGDKLPEAQPHRSAKGPQFDHINPALPPFAFADECLSLADLVRKLGLRDTGPNSRVPENFQEDGVPG